MKAKEFIPAGKPRNFVAKNAPTSGAGRHKDSSKKKDIEQGKVKHKKDLVPMEGLSEMELSPDTARNVYSNLKYAVEKYPKNIPILTKKYQGEFPILKGKSTEEILEILKDLASQSKKQDLGDVAARGEEDYIRKSGRDPGKMYHSD